MNKYECLRRVLKWCNAHREKNFYYHDVGISSHMLSSMCDTTFRGNVWLVRKGKSVTRDSNNGLLMYSLASWVDLDSV